MTLRGPNTRFVLSFSGPDNDDWCHVKIDLETAEGRWSAIDPCLRSSEVKSLAAWLNAVANETNVERLEFMEPELEFGLDAVRPNWFFVELRYNMQPTWAGLDSDDPFLLSFPAEPGQLQHAAQSLLAALPTQSHRNRPADRNVEKA